MGFSYEEFLNMTWKEFTYYSVGYERRLERDWDFTRHIIAASFNSSGFAKKSVKATEVIKLPHLDRAPVKKVERMPSDRLTKLLSVLNANKYIN